MVEPKRCSWCLGDEADIHYHDTQWGVPVYDDQTLFEFITLEGAQAGLSWRTILHKRDNYRRLFAQFDIQKISRFNEHKVETLMQDAGIVRNRLKITSTISNAQAMITVQQEFGSFSDYLWGFVDHKPIQNSWPNMQEVPTSTDLSDQLSRDLKKRGFRFIGTTICYAYMQAIGLVNDHSTDCFRHKQLRT